MSKRLLAPPRARSATATAALCGEQRGGWRGKAPPGARGLVGLPNFWRNGRLAENRLSDLASLHSQHQNLDTHHGIDLGGSLF